MNREIEDALSSAGFNLVDDPTPQQNEPVQETAEPAQGAPQEAPVEAQQPVQEVSTSGQPEVNVDDIDVDAEVLKHLSERLGQSFDSYDSISEALSYTPTEIDERVKAINDFVVNTGRSVDDWYKYQSLQPSEMDDLAAVKYQMQMDNPSLSAEEVDILAKRKYVTDEYADDEDKSYAAIQLKMDAEKARKTLNEHRETYALPDVDSGYTNEAPPEDWVNNMTQSTNDFDYLEFALPGGKSFRYGVEDDYRSSLVEKNTRLNEYFDSYLDNEGNWNFDMLNAHRTLIDNIDKIASSLYNQGLSDGRRGVVNQAANVSGVAPQVEMGSGSSSIGEQVERALGGSSLVTFKNV